jgi:hypothetical protein
MRNEQLGSISEKEKKKKKKEEKNETCTLHIYSAHVLELHAASILHNSIPANSQIVVCIVDKYLKNKSRPLIKK